MQTITAQTIVHYVLADGTRGTYAAPTADRAMAAAMTCDQLHDDGELGFHILPATA